MTDNHLQQSESSDFLHDLGLQIVALHGQAAAIYKPMVKAIIESDSKDVKHIEYVLDYLLGFAGDEKCLMLYKKLCRHYWFIDPSAAADYVRYYREMYDEDSLTEVDNSSTARCKTIL